MPSHRPPGLRLNASGTGRATGGIPNPWAEERCNALARLAEHPMHDKHHAISDPSESWRRTLYASVSAQFLVNAGIGFVFPFLPFFIETLGVETEREVRWWTGVVFASSGFTMCLFSPIWGAVGDKYGRKLMVLRSMLALGIVMPLMGMASHPSHLVVLRLTQGIFSGTITANMAMVAGVVPLDRVGYAMGLIYVAADAGRVLGPSIGGTMADLVGFRATFLTTGALPLAGAALIGFFARDSTPESDSARASGSSVSLAALIGIGGVTAVLGVLFLNQFSQSLAGPLIPLFVASVLTTEHRASSMTGWIISANALVKIVSAGYLGRLGDRVGHGRVLCFGVCVAVLSLFLHAFANHVAHLFLLRGMVGVSAAAILPSGSALLRSLAPPQAIGKVLGLSQSVRSLGTMAGPLAGGIISAQVAGIWGLRLPFVLSGGMLAVLLFAIGRNIAGQKAVKKPTGSSGK